MMDIPKNLVGEDLDIEAFVLEMDPDWSQRFLSVDDAFKFYWKYSSVKTITDTIKAIT